MHGSDRNTFDVTTSTWTPWFNSSLVSNNFLSRKSWYDPHVLVYRL